LHWSAANRFPGAVWSAAGVWIGVAAPFAVVLRYAGFPGAWPPVWLPLLDPVLHSVAAAALLAWFCRRERLDAWHLGLDRHGIDAAAAWVLGLVAAGAPGAAAALADSDWVERAPLLFAPGQALLRAAEFEPGTGTRVVAVLSCLCRIAALGPAREIILTGLLYPTFRRKWAVLPSAAACALLATALDARIVECGFEPCLWPTLQLASAAGAAGLASTLAYERFRTLWIPVAVQAGFALFRLAPGIPGIFS
jgi:membrane protease YdiL (CAAX protease family)